MWAGAALAAVYSVVAGLTRHDLVSGILAGVTAGLLWLWMAWKSNAGRNWARVLSSVFFGAAISGLLGSVADRRWTPALLVFLIECGVGLAAVILLWRPQSSQFFAAARQPKLTAAAVPPYPGTADPTGIQGPGSGRPAEAIPLYERTLADREQVLGSAHPDTLTARNNLAGAYQPAGRLAEAIPLYERTLADREQVLGGTHPSTLTSRNNLAGAYRSAGRLAEAIPLYERTLADREQVLGDAHPETLSCRNNLASAYYQAGRLAEAIPLYERTLADREQVLGGTHPSTLTSRNNLALAYRAAGRLAEAEDLQKRAERTS
jgi:hypothetical protein